MSLEKLPVAEATELMPGYAWAAWDEAVEALDPKPVRAPTTSPAYDNLTRRAVAPWEAHHVRR